jgi:hypothetical protein
MNKARPVEFPLARTWCSAHNQCPAIVAKTDWSTWHAGYRDPDSILGQRLRIVKAFIAEFLKSRDGALRTVSLCAGQGLDLLDVLADDPRPERVNARLIELDPRLAASAKRRASEAELGGVEVLIADASCTDNLVGAVPADLVLACGVFGNISDDDVERTVRALPELCVEHGTVIWTRHTWPPDLTPQIRRWFGEAGFKELRFSSPGPESYSVGMNELVASPRPLQTGQRLFTFVDPLERPAAERATPRPPFRRR